MEKICQMCHMLIDCDHLDPWGLKKDPLGYQVNWCQFAQDTIGGTESSRETPLAWLRYDPKETPMTWQHKVEGRKTTKAKKIIYLLKKGYSVNEILETLNVSESYVYLIKKAYDNTRY
jgi:hypothetical protein